MFVDTATLYPISLADLVLRLAELGMFELVWSDHLLAEVERVLVEYKCLPVDRARYFCDCIRDAFPSGRVPPEQYLPLLDSRTGPDPDDHVLAGSHAWSEDSAKRRPIAAAAVSSAVPVGRTWSRSRSLS